MSFKTDRRINALSLFWAQKLKSDWSIKMFNTIIITNLQLYNISKFTYSIAKHSNLLGTG